MTCWSPPRAPRVPVEAIETEQRTEADAERVYNFHVETRSNYYVHTGDVAVLVHNASHGDCSGFPERSLPRDSNGRNIPDSEFPHTQLGQGRKGTYPAAREFGNDGEVIRDIHWTDHGRAAQHTNPHQHRYSDNPTGGDKRRGPAEPLEE